MKRVLILMLTCLVFGVNAQNYIGQSKLRIINDLKKNADYGKIEFVNDGDGLVMKYENADNTIVHYYYLNVDSKCTKFLIVHKDPEEFKSVVKGLNKNYDRESDRTWIEHGQNEFLWTVDKKDNYFSLIVTKLSETQVTNSL